METTRHDTGYAPPEELARALTAWRQQVEAELKGVPFEKKLMTRTPEGIALRPLYTRADTLRLPHLDRAPGEAPYLRGFAPRAAGSERRWEVCQEITAQRAYEFNRALLADLMAGQDSVALTPDLATRAGLDPDEAPAEFTGEGGVSLLDHDDVAAALRGVDLSAVPLHVRAGAEPLALAALVLEEARARGVSPAQLRGSLTVDPVAFWLEAGRLPAACSELFDQMAGWTRWSSAEAPQLRTIGVDASLWQDAGGNAVQALAYALATAVEYVRELQKRGIDLAVVAPRLRFSFSAGPQFFMEVAKLRAWRVLWTRVVLALGAAPELATKAAVHARTGRWDQTLLDPQVNLLRSTTEALSAVLGGADSVHVAPFDEASGRTDDSSRRIARNVHTLLAEEFRFTVPTDAAGGSWYVETLTDELARKAWTLFQDIEKAGGMVAALKKGLPQQQVRTTAGEKASALATRKSTLVGTNIFPNSRDKLPASRRPEREALRITRGRAAHERRGSASVAQVQTRSWPECLQAARVAARDGATVGQLARLGRISAQPGPELTPRVEFNRAAEPFEALRARAATLPEKPRVFLAKMGPVSQHKARADFSAGFFAVGGFEAIAKRNFESAEDAAQAALASGAPVAVLCSTDDTYPELAPTFARTIKTAKPGLRVVLAGLPGDPSLSDGYKAAGVDDFIHVRADVTATLGQILSSLEASA